jgi:anti-sigma factor RsiW
LSEHLSIATLNALADGELTADQLASVAEHLAGCRECTSDALAQSLLKTATARAGQRYVPPADLRERLLAAAHANQREPEAGARRAPAWGRSGWLAVAAVLLAAVSAVITQRTIGREETAAADYSALVAEVSDQHVATLAANAPPEVVSSDRHTVKPWFQGKIPFSFNLPQDLPADVTLDGANLAYLRSQPTAQLLYSVGKHRVSVFVRERGGGGEMEVRPADYRGFHVAGFRAGDLVVMAVSDVDEARLRDLVGRIEAAQAEAR